MTKPENPGAAITIKADERGIIAGQEAWLRRKVESLNEDEVLCVGAHGRPTPHTWIRLEQEALDRLARVSKMALDARVAERQIRITERTGAEDRGGVGGGGRAVGVAAGGAVGDGAAV